MTNAVGMESISESSVEQALQSAFGGEEEQPEAAAPPPEAEIAEGVEEVVAEAEEAPAEEAAEPEPEVEPEYEIEVEGQRLTVRGKEEIVKRLQQAEDYSRKSEHNARVRDALTLQYKAQQEAGEFQKQFMQDITELKALDQRLEEWNKMDWAAAFDSDPFNALKLKEQRDSLREARQAKFQELNGKHQSFMQGQAEAARRLRQAEEAALLAKLPEWRNSEKASTEKQAIANTLINAYGFSPDEVNSVMDHRVLVLARDAYAYRQLKQSAPAKQVRTAPPVSKPGATAKPNAKAEFGKNLKQIKAFGQHGNHKAQEAAFTQLLERAFK